MTVLAAYRARVAEGALREDPAQLTALAAMDRIREELAKPVKTGLFRRAPAPIRGLYLWGGVGRGKSMLMDLAVSEIDVPKRRAHFHAFMQWVHDEMGKARARGVDDAIAPVADQIAADVRLLAFDEMQIGDVADAMIVGRLFERIFAGGVVVITTSNRPPEDLYKDGLNRQIFVPFIEMMQQRLEVHHLHSDTDYRQTVLSGSPSYFTPASAEARDEIRRIWQGLTGGHAEPMVLRVKGRDVEIPAFHGGCARARFFDLCGKPLGAADYLALAEATRVLVLEDIPRLSRSNFNEARRFVTLIDALYEARVKLICSAADIPESLYSEGEGSFEFERTASRLREMQGADWGQDT